MSTAQTWTEHNGLSTGSFCILSVVGFVIFIFFSHMVLFFVIAKAMINLLCTLAWAAVPCYMLMESAGTAESRTVHLYLKVQPRSITSTSENHTGITHKCKSTKEAFRPFWVWLIFSSQLLFFRSGIQHHLSEYRCSVSASQLGRVLALREM